MSELKKAEVKSRVEVTKGGSGYFAVIMWWNPDMDGFWEPWNTGCGRYETIEPAIEEAKQIAECEGLEYYDGN